MQGVRARRLIVAASVITFVLLVGSVASVHVATESGIVRDNRNDSGVTNISGPQQSITTTGSSNYQPLRQTQPNASQEQRFIHYARALPKSGQVIESRGSVSNACGASGGVCGNLTYHNGPVMHGPSDFMIFWLPPGYHFDNSTISPAATNPSDSSYEQLVIRYFSDICRPNSFYSIVQQYPDSFRPIYSCNVGGYWIDTSNYPDGRGSLGNPLTYADVENEVSNALSTNSWSSNGGNSEFFVFTGYRVCSTLTGCGGDPYCAYHSWFLSSDGSPVVYANMPNVGNTACQEQIRVSPNNDIVADSEINLVSHEQFEAFTDPTGGGWFYNDGAHEIGDECAGIFDSIGATLRVGADGYRIQDEWSNSAGGCTSRGLGCAATLLETDVLGCDGLSPTTVGLTWGQSNYTSFTRYDVEESTSGKFGPWTTVDRIASLTNTTDYIRGLIPSATYWWQVVDVGPCQGTCLTKTTEALMVTQPGIGVVGFEQVHDTTYKLTWSNSADYTGFVAFDSYQLEESANRSAYVSVQTITRSSTMNFTINDLSSATDYSFYVNTTDKCGTCASSGAAGTRSNIIRFTTPMRLAANASAQPGFADLGQQLSFSCTASGGIAPYNYTWSFGDGSGGTGQFVTRGFTFPGTLSVECTVLDSLRTSATSQALSVNIYLDPTVDVHADHNSVDIGQPVLFTAQVNGGSGGESYSWSGLPPGCTARNVAAFWCQPTATGSFRVGVVAMDSAGISANSALSLAVSSAPSISILTASSYVLDLGQTVTFGASASGGYGALFYTYYGLPQGCASTNSTSLSCTPSYEGNHSITVSVTDQNGFYTASDPITITVNKDPSVIVNALPSEIDVGQEATLIVSPVYGSAPYSYSYSGLPQGCSSPHTTTFRCMFAASGSYIVNVTITDSRGVQSSSVVDVEVNARPAITSFQASSSTLNFGQDLTLTVSVEGGTLPLSYSYSGLPPGCSASSSSTITCKPSASGSYDVQVTLTDARGITASSSVGVEVRPQLLFGLPLWEGYTLIGALAVTVLGASIGVVRLRKRRVRPVA